MEVELPADIQAKLSRLATARGRNPEILAREAIERYVDYDEWFVREVDQGGSVAQNGITYVAEDKTSPGFQVGSSYVLFLVQGSWTRLRQKWGDDHRNPARRQTRARWVQAVAKDRRSALTSGWTFIYSDWDFVVERVQPTPTEGSAKFTTAGRSRRRAASISRARTCKSAGWPIASSNGSILDCGFGSNPRCDCAVTTAGDKHRTAAMESRSTELMLRI
jgi:predicted transcriptional regulator